MKNDSSGSKFVAMPTISPLLPTDQMAAYRVERASHHYPYDKETFLSHHGKLYLNLKVLERCCLESYRREDSCQEDYHLVGFAITQVVADEASLLNIAVHPAAQRRGYARQLLFCLIEKLQARAVRTLWLEVRVSNFKARALYKQLAFNEISIRYDYYPAAQGREDAMILARTIS